jgi:hypothetical protein
MFERGGDPMGAAGTPGSTIVPAAPIGAAIFRIRGDEV